MSLKIKTLSGFFWSLSQQFGMQIISTVVTIILARILDPKDFGLIGMLAIFMALGNSLIDAGLTSSLIRSKELSESDYSTVFYINLMGSLVVYFIMFFSSKFISGFFEQPQLESIIKVYCLSFIFSAFASVQRTRLVKKMDFKTELKVTLPSVFLSGTCGIILALQGFGVWALVWMMIVQQMLVSIQFWLHSKWRPKLIFDAKRFFYHFDFGYKMTLASIINSVFSNAYYLVIGKYFPVEQLGFYTKADQLKQIPVKNISNTLGRVTFPLFSEMQDDDQRLQVAYKKVIQQVLFWLTPVMVLAAVLAEPVFRVILTEKWLPAVPYFQILCFIGLMYPIHSYNLNILKVKGRSDLFLKLEILKKSLTVIGIIIALNFGIYALLISQVILNLISFIINSFFSGKFIGYDLKSQIKDILPIFGIGILSGLAALITKNFIIFRLGGDFPQIIFGAFGALLVYFMLSWVSKAEPFIEFKRIILKK